MYAVVFIIDKGV